MGRTPTERAALAVRVLDELIAARQTSPVEARAVGGGFLIGVGRRAIVGLTPLDIDEAAGETLQGVANQAVQRLQQALAEADEARRPGTWLTGGAQALAAVVVSLLVLRALSRMRRKVTTWLSPSARKAVMRAGLQRSARNAATRLLNFVVSRVVFLVNLGLQLFVAYLVVTFVLNRFPYTRAWGESFRSFLIATIGNLILGIVYTIPDLFTVLVIVLITRVVINLLRLWFDAVEGEADPDPMGASGDSPHHAPAGDGLLWLFAAVMAYPYVPGSETEAFKGVSVFLGLIVTLGVERARQSDDERLHADLLARAAGGRLRQGRRRRGDDRAHRHSLRQAQDPLVGGSRRSPTRSSSRRRLPTIRDSLIRC